MCGLNKGLEAASGVIAFDNSLPVILILVCRIIN